MKTQIAIFPGSFDPITAGHIDIIERASRILDSIYVAILNNPEKQGLFTIDERVALASEALEGIAGVTVESFFGLLVDYAKEKKASLIIRGLRAVSDYEYEAQMALMNRNLNPDIETFFMMTSESHSYVSSSVIRQIAHFGGDVSRFVPENVEKALKGKFS